MDLKTSSLFALVDGHKNLDEVIKKIESNPILLDASLQSETFWYKMANKAERRMGAQYVQHAHLSNRRGDLKTGRDWYEYAKGLNAGISYKLGVIKKYTEGGPADGVWIPKVISPYSIVESSNEGHVVENIFTFEMPGTRPKEGTKGYFYCIDSAHIQANYKKSHSAGVIIMDEFERGEFTAKYITCTIVSEMLGCKEHAFCDLHIEGNPNSPIEYEELRPTSEDLMAAWDDTRPFQRWTLSFYTDDLETIVEIRSKVYVLEVEF